MDCGLRGRWLVHAAFGQGTPVYPFTGGGANWGGAAYAPMSDLLIVNMNNLAHDIQLTRASLSSMRAGCSATGKSRRRRELRSG